MTSNIPNPRCVQHARILNLCALMLVLPLLSTAFSQTADVERAELPNPRNEIERSLLDQLHQAGVEEIVFAMRPLSADGHWYANFGYYADWEHRQPGKDVVYDGERRVAYSSGAKLVRLNLKTGKKTILIDDPKGGVRDPVVHYDAQKVLFSYRPGGTRNYHLYEVNLDGTGLLQLTDGPFDDIEPTYLPAAAGEKNDIIFVSSRCKRWVNCWITEVAVLHRCKSDGSGIRPISSNNEHDNTPWVMPNGQILYTRWEYVDRSQVNYHHLWSAYPDGTHQTVYFGNQNPGITMIDAKPIPGSRKIIASFAPGHGRKDHCGVLNIVDPRMGPDDKAMARAIAPAGKHANSKDVNFLYRDPWAFSESLFIAARVDTIEVLDDKGHFLRLYTSTKSEKAGKLWVHEPRPVIRREQEPRVADATQSSTPFGRVVLADVNSGRNMDGVKPGEIKKLLVLETLPKPINFTGGMDPLTYCGSFTLERVLGTVPVEPDGSAHMELPALRSLLFVALDENDMSVKRMQSFMTVMPGESTSCVGCHEQRTQTVLPAGSLMALQRKPSSIEPIKDCPDVFDFPRDIQPILDNLCVDCHGYKKTERGGPYAGSIVLTGDHGPMFSHAYYEMTVHKMFSDGRNLIKSNYAPRTLGSSASRVLKMLDGSHYNVKASRHEKRMMRLWIEVGAPYPGTYAALGGGSIGGYQENKQVHTDYDWPETHAADKTISNRCTGCHKGKLTLPKALSDENGLSFWKPSMDDPRLMRSRHIVFNLSRPELSLMLLAPLSKDAGGFGICGKAQNGQPVFKGRDDPGYQNILNLCVKGKGYLENITRFDMPDFKPRKPYLRELQRYGVLAKNFDIESTDNASVDTYKLDQDYWRSLWIAGQRAE